MALPSTTKVPDTDLSGRMLDTIFGSGWENVITGTHNSVSSNMVFPILEAFNTVALAGVSLLFVWIISIGVVGTAHEGKALGKRYSTLWTPIRGALTVSMLAPIVKGVSLFQVALLACIGFSINGANTVYETGVNVFVEQGGMLVAGPPPQLQENASELAASILRSQVVQAYFEYWEDKSLPDRKVYESIENEQSNEKVLQFNAPEQTGIENEVMGKIILECPPGGICQQRQDALVRLINDIIPIADAIVDPDQSPNVDELVNAADDYGTAVMEAITSRSEAMGDLTDELEQFKSQATSSGWATAGAYYFSIAKINDRRRNALQADAKSINPNIAVVSSHATEDFERIAAVCDTYIRNSLLRNTPSKISETAQVAEDSQIMGLLRKMFSWLFAEKIFSGLAKRVTENDPVSTVIDYGHTLITGTSVGFQTYLAAAGAVGTAKGWSDSLVGQVLGVATGGTKSAFVGATEN
ncbi:MAG: DotA/TraY family protein, partial [Desulfobacteraceae bacterium]